MYVCNTMYVCMCVCVYVCMYVFMYVCMYVCMSVCMYACILYVCTNTTICTTRVKPVFLSCKAALQILSHISTQYSLPNIDLTLFKTGSTSFGRCGKTTSLQLIATFNKNKMAVNSFSSFFTFSLTVSSYAS